MSRVTLILTNQDVRDRAKRWIDKAPPGCRFELKEAKRSTDQNALMWASLTEIARQVEWHGLKLSADDWKLILMSGLNQEMRLVPNVDGTGFVNLGRSSSDLSKAEMGELIELIFAFGAREGVVFQGSEGAGVGGESRPARAA